MNKEKGRKARRKEERTRKKRKRSHQRDSQEEEPKSGLKKDPSKALEKQLSTQSPHKKSSSQRKKHDPYAGMDPDLAAAMRRDDEEIAALQAKLGLRDKKQKDRLSKEYAKLEGYGDDFGEFLDDLEGMVRRISQPKVGEEGEEHGSGNIDSDVESDEEVPMKARGPLGPANDDDDEVEEEELVVEDHHSFDDLDDDDSVMDEINNETIDDGTEELEPDHDDAVTYRPNKGEDIYGRKIPDSSNETKNEKYVPPHLRAKQEQKEDNNTIGDDARQEKLRSIQRMLNNVLNKLSENSIVSVAQSIAQVYLNHGSGDVNECCWRIMKNACVARTRTMVELVPIYVAALSGAHILRGNNAQLGEYLMEQAVVDLWIHIKSFRLSATLEEEADEVASKEAANLILCLCYLYNFNVIHCSLLYGIVRELIESFEDEEVELLLLILKHSGRQLRSDDPSALKDIVLLIQKRALELKGRARNESRIDFMVTEMMNLKNNKTKNSQAAVIAEKVIVLRKILGKIKSGASAQSGEFQTTSAQRVTLKDILDAETKGRFWKVGAKWIGNQHQYIGIGSHEKDDLDSYNDNEKSEENMDEETKKLMKLAEKYRMNSDVRRLAFRIIMGSSDFEEAFERLTRSDLLKNRTERETARVLMECCGHEKAFNKYYAHLAARICEFQPQCKFTFQLAFWDAFKTLDYGSARKAANLAKLLFHLVVVHQTLRLQLIKGFDVTSPDELDEVPLIFMTVFLSCMVDHFEDSSDLGRMIEHGIDRGTTKDKKDEFDSDDLIEGGPSDGDSLRASLTIFFLRVLKSSPKNKKGSKFRANLKAAVAACAPDN